MNILVLDTEVYSNTGGQASKATPRGAVAKFAAGGKRGRKKDLGLMAMTLRQRLRGQVAMGAAAQQTLEAFLEAEAYDGPSLIIAYSHCIAHGIDMRYGMQQQKLAVECGQWPLYRFKPGDRGRDARGVRARLAGAVDPGEDIHLQRDPLQDALLHEAGGGQAPAEPRAGRRRSALARLLRASSAAREWPATAAHAARARLAVASPTSQAARIGLTPT